MTKPRIVTRVVHIVKARCVGNQYGSWLFVTYYDLKTGEKWKQRYGKEKNR